MHRTWAWLKPLAVLLLLSAIGACANGAGGSDDAMARRLSGTISGWPQRSGELVAELSDGTELQVIAEGTVNSAGTVDVTLPDRVERVLLTPLRDALPCPDATGTPADARVAILFSLTVLQDGEASAAIAQASSDAATFPLPSEAGAYRVFRWYADRAATVQGTCTSAGQGYEHRWSLDLERGWNVVVETIEEASQGSEVRASRTAPLPEDARWYFLDVMMAP